MSRFKVKRTSHGASIMYANKNNSLDAFIDVYDGSDGFPSPFKTVEDCEFFATVIMNLFEITDYDIERPNNQTTVDRE